MSADHILRRAREVARALGKAEALLVTAGAGMSVDSGLPDYRGNQGFWRAYPPFGQLGISFERMAQPYWFAEKPHMAWAWYRHRALLYRQTRRSCRSSRHGCRGSRGATDPAPASTRRCSAN